jgi:hypothetical protein
LYHVATAAEDLAKYLEETLDPSRDEVMRLVHEINLNYVDWAEWVDTAQLEVLD